MRLLEFEAKQLLSDVGIEVPREALVSSPAEAEAYARGLGVPVVVKAQVPAGGRMKAGGVLFASTPADAASAARTLLGATIRGYPVEQVAVQERIEAATAVYLAATLDAAARRAVVLASLEGGIEIETSASVIRQVFSLRQPYPPFRARELASRLLSGQAVPLAPLAQIIQAVVGWFQAHSALLVEVNPLLLTREGRWVAVDAHIELDEDAAFRQRDLVARFGLAGRGERRRTLLEQRAAEIDGADHRGVAGRVVEFDGDLALLIGGGGASLTIFDAVLDAGGKPANYCELGGNPSVWKVAELTKLLLSKPGVTRLAVIMNVVNNTRVDLVARGVIKGILETGRDPSHVIAVFRIPGSWEEEGMKILRRYGVRAFGRELSLNEAAERANEGGVT
ncbi:MAG: acetate--CoA ligase family protein [Chloroflexi bacterium]|nr:acetate--CoA ligase family protein [Chloroflexota bacterium]